MIFYLANGQLYPTQAAAPKGFIQHDVPTDKPGLMAYINELLLDRSPSPPAEEPLAEVSPPPPPAPIVFEDQWEQFPLALKLHYAALAMEDAREILK